MTAERDTPPEQDEWNALDRWLAARLNGYYRSPDYPYYTIASGALAVIGGMELSWRIPFPWDILVLVNAITVLVILARLNYYFVAEVPRVRTLKQYVKEQATANPGAGVAEPDSVPRDVDPPDGQGGDKVSEGRSAQSP